MATSFRTKRDRWLVILIWAGALLSIVGGVAQMGIQAPAILRGITLLFLVGAAGFMLWVLYTTEYSISEVELLARCGPFRYRVPLSEIESVTPSRDPRSSPAGSLDRLLICWSGGRRRLLISPEPRREFLQQLSAHCPHLRLRGDQLIRNGAV